VGRHPRAEHDLVAAPFGGRVDGLEQVGVERVAGIEHHAEHAGVVFAEHLRGGVGPVAQLVDRP
jgi:hypothetical protein